MSERFLGIRLAPGVQPINLAAFYVAALVAILVFSFMNQAQILLLKVNLGVDAARAGSISGDLVFWGEVVVLGGLFVEWDATSPLLVFDARCIVVAVWALLVRDRVVSQRELGEHVGG